jgi:hypothetical protein
MGDKLEWESALKRPQKITSTEWDSMSWMTFDYEVEIRARSIDDATKHELFCRNFGGHWSMKQAKFFRIPEERMDFQTQSMKGWYKGCLSELVKVYNTTLIGRTKFLCALKEAAVQYVITEAKNAKSNNKNNSESRRIFLNKMNSTIIQWRTYLDFVMDDGLVMDEAKVDDFVAMVERAKTIYSEGGRGQGITKVEAKVRRR